MTFNHTTTINYKTNTGTVAASVITQSSATEQALDNVITAGASNVHFVMAVDVEEVISFLMYSDQAITVKTNSSSAPAQTFLLQAGIGFTWNSARPDANPLTTDITDFYITNAGAVDANIQFSFLLQP